MVESGFTFKHTLVLVKADGTIQTKTTDTLKAVFGWDGVDPFWLMDNSGGWRRHAIGGVRDRRWPGDWGQGRGLFQEPVAEPAGRGDEDASGGGPALGAGEVREQISGAGRGWGREGREAEARSRGQQPEAESAEIRRCRRCRRPRRLLRHREW